MYSSISVATVVLSVVLPLLAVIATCLRFKAQRRIRAAWSLEDTLMAINGVALVGSGCLTIVGATIGGIGANLDEVDENVVVRFRKIDFASEFFYISTVGLVKLSLLLFYRRTFVLSLVSSTFQKLNMAMFALVGCWMLAMYIATLLQARPISWNWTGVGSVVNLHDFFVAQAVSDIALDFFVLCMPTVIVYRMKLPPRKKILVIGIFSLGFFCMAASIVRLYYVTRYFMAPQNYAASADAIAKLDLWSLIEPCASTICVSLPCMGPLFRHGWNLPTFMQWSIFQNYRTSNSNNTTATNRELLSGSDPKLQKLQQTRSNTSEGDYRPDSGIPLDDLNASFL